LKNLLTLIICFFSISICFTQETVGTIQNSDESLDGYTFFSPFSSTKAYLVDNCGRLINEWDRGTNPGLSAYFLDNGLVLRTYKVSPKGPFTSASNAGGLELVDWDNNTIWNYEINTSEWLSHHDVVMMPNGNLLVLTWQLVYKEELVSLGRNPDEIAIENFMWSERIIELEIVGSDDVNIVWEWNIKDHYIQEYDNTKEGYGVIEEHPELFNINLPELNSSNSNSTRDWNHFNAIDYNADLDQILISVRNSDEVWILDHSTTTEEAAGHTGGVYGKGGDILYRWGNGSAYNRAPVSEQKLFGQHGVNWIDNGLEGAGGILIYNNGNGRPGPDFSTVEILNPPQNEDGHYVLETNKAYGPLENDWIYGDQSGEQFYSPYLSNAQRLSNGNTLINAGSPNSIFEILPDRSLVWEYVIPLNGDFPVTQGQNASGNGNFRAYKFGSDYPGFDGKDLTPGNPIELNPNECDVTSSLYEVEQKRARIYYEPLQRQIIISGQTNELEAMSIYDFSGRILYRNKSGQFNSWTLPMVTQGVYLVNLVYRDGQRSTEKLFIY
jgi:hypothetical protein